MKSKKPNQEGNPMIIASKIESTHVHRIFSRARRCLVIGVALAAAGCSAAAPGPEASVDPQGVVAPAAVATAARPVQTTATKSTPAGFAMATLGLFKDSELTEGQELELIRVRNAAVSAQRARHEDALALRAARQAGTDATALHQRVDASLAKEERAVTEALDGALALYATLSPAQRAAIVTRARAATSSSEPAGTGLRDRERASLEAARAGLVEELGKPVADTQRVERLAQASVAAHGLVAHAALARSLARR